MSETANSEAKQNSKHRLSTTLNFKTCAWKNKGWKTLLRKTRAIRGRMYFKQIQDVPKYSLVSQNSRLKGVFPHQIKSNTL